MVIQSSSLPILLVASALHCVCGIVALYAKGGSSIAAHAGQNCLNCTRLLCRSVVYVLTDAIALSGYRWTGLHSLSFQDFLITRLFAGKQRHLLCSLEPPPECRGNGCLGKQDIGAQFIRREIEVAYGYVNRNCDDEFVGVGSDVLPGKRK